jgi:membrane-bound lytic murein transglycosylase MltF
VILPRASAYASSFRSRNKSAALAVARNRAHVAAAGLVASDARHGRVHFGPVFQRIDQYVVYRVGRTAERLPTWSAGASSQELDPCRSCAPREEIPGLTWTAVKDGDTLDLLDRGPGRGRRDH